jgi:LPPG:FO 2-phospho-L-lactate transferase
VSLPPVTSPHYVLLSGGVGGAKLALGLSRCLGPGQLTIIANTGDDFRHLGLAISPDLDTLLYTLAGLANPETGWGRAGETWSCMAALEQLGGETWFRLGDGDLALHVERTRLLAAGMSLTEVTRHFCRQLGVGHTLLPMTDDTVETVIETDEGDLAFQDYFVRRQAKPRVRGVRYEGADRVPPSAAMATLLTDPGLAGIFIAPSNPWLSIDPILAIPFLGAALRSSRAPVIAVSPLVGGRALKGPTAKIMEELGLAVTSHSIASHYRELLDAFVLDTVDAADAPAIADLGLTPAVTPTVMASLEDRVALARFCLELAGRLSGGH